MLRTILAVILLAAKEAVAGEIVASAEPFEINAVRSQEGRFDYVAQVHGNNDSFCTGTLISDNVVLTAAHCFAFSDLQSLVIDASVQFGDNSTATLTKYPATPSTAVAVHPLYKRGSPKYDIALIRIELSNYTGPPPTSLPAPIKHLAQGPITSADYSMTITSLGWGNTDPTDDNPTQFLRDVNLTLTDPSSPPCQDTDMENTLLQDNSGFCMLGAFPTAQELPTLPSPSFPTFRKGFCNGDSGGPTVVQGATSGDDVLIGVNAYLLSNDANVRPCGNPLVGDISTSVGAYAGFIQSVLRKFQDDALPLVNITGVGVSQIRYATQGFGKSGLVTFLVTLSIQTSYLMERIGVFDTVGPLLQPGFALRSAGPGHNASTVLPFKIVGFDAPSFTYTLEAVNYQVVADFALDYFGGQVHFNTGLQVLFRPFGNKEYINIVAEVSAQRLKIALCSRPGTFGPLDSIVVPVAIFHAFCARA